MNLFLHTETTGRWLFKNETLDTSQPLMVLICARLIGDDMDHPVDEMCQIVRPLPGYTVEEGAARHHGVTHEMAETQGLLLRATMEKFGRMAAASMTLTELGVDWGVK